MWALHKVAVNTFLPSSVYLASHQLLFANSSFVVFLLIRSKIPNKPHRPPSMPFISELKQSHHKIAPFSTSILNQKHIRRSNICNGVKLNQTGADTERAIFDSEQYCPPSVSHHQDFEAETRILHDKMLVRTKLRSNLLRLYIYELLLNVLPLPPTCRKQQATGHRFARVDNGLWGS